MRTVEQIVDEYRALGRATRLASDETCSRLAAREQQLDAELRRDHASSLREAVDAVVSASPTPRF